MSELFNDYIYGPILSVLVFIYNNFSFGDLGIAIILLTIFIRIILFPIFYKSAKDQSLMQALQPHIKKIQLDHKENKEEQAKAMMALYKEHKLNPFSGIFLIILQLPIFIALFQIFSKTALTDIFDNHSLLGLINLEEKNLLIVLIAAAFQYFQGKLSMVSNTNTISQNNPMAGAGKMMVYIGPLLTFVVLFNLPSALGLYWAVSNLFSLGQQYIINKKIAIPKHD